MTWFSKLTGFPEKDPEWVRENLLLEEEHLVSKVNHRRMRMGRFHVPSLSELRHEIPWTAPTQVAQLVGDVKDLHLDETNEGALFQVASQFNCLEMVAPNYTPEDGVGIYELDRTQGPICAICAGSGTIFRNYFIPLANQVGQSKDNQLDCLKEIGVALGNGGNRFWEMKNGYCLATSFGLESINEQLVGMSIEERELLKGQLRVGWQENTEVTISANKHCVSQAFCSALPVAYSQHSESEWEPFARLILEAAYEATFWLALMNLKRTGSNSVYLTMLGGGAFGNPTDWILDAISVNLQKFEKAGLNVRMVSYRQPDPQIARFIDSLNLA